MKARYGLARLIPLVCLLWLAGPPVWAETILASDYGYSVDLIEGWKVADISPAGAIAFQDPSGDLVFRISAYDAAEYPSAEAIADLALERLKASGDRAGFSYEGRGAVFADLRFSTGGKKQRGYFVFIDGTGHDWLLMAFADEESFERAGDLLLSCLDSFAPDEPARRRPGPVSQFYYPYPAPKREKAAIGPKSSTLDGALDPGENEAAQTVIDREARILAGYERAARGHDTRRADAAWRRFFRVVWRDNYERLAPAARELGEKFGAAAGKRDPRLPGMLLAWFQSFNYDRPGGASDLKAPLYCFAAGSGDCDSLGLAYVIVLQQLGWDALLMVSAKHGHAMAAVDVPGAGARFPFEGKDYLVAELTTKVAIGMIAAEMADPADWLGVALGRPVR